MKVTIRSFGWKFGEYGSGAIIDARVLTDPSKNKALRMLDGTHPQLQARIVENPMAETLISQAWAVYDAALEDGEKEVEVCFGCQFGKHRSVALAEVFASEILALECGDTVDI